MQHLTVVISLGVFRFRIIFVSVSSWDGLCKRSVFHAHHFWHFLREKKRYDNFSILLSTLTLIDCHFPNLQWHNFYNGNRSNNDNIYCPWVCVNSFAILTKRPSSKVHFWPHVWIQGDSTVFLKRLLNIQTNDLQIHIVGATWWKV